MKCPECRMKNNTHKLDCSKRYKQEEIDEWLLSWAIGTGSGSSSDSSADSASEQ